MGTEPGPRDHAYMTSPQPQPKLTQVVATALSKQTAHDRQRELVRASLLCR